ncbi:hypothetical protein Tco_0969364 [Tanacetum coccineum]
MIRWCSGGNGGGGNAASGAMHPSKGAPLQRVVDSEMGGDGDEYHVKVSQHSASGGSDMEVRGRIVILPPMVMSVEVVYNWLCFLP